MPQPRTLDVGRDVHQASMAVAYVANAYGAEVVALGSIGTRPCDIAMLLRPRHAQSQHLGEVDAAGPCGSWLARYQTKHGSVCGVVAPSLIPQQAGARVNTARRAAVPWARLLRSGELTPVDGPQVADEAIRDLSRAREEARRALTTATFRLNALRLRPDMRETGPAHWRPAPRSWRAAVGCPTPAPPRVCQAYGRAVTAHPARLQRRAQARHAPVHTWRLAPVVEALQALRGVQGTVAVTSVAARGARTRGDHPRQRMRYLGLTPSAYASGERRRQGGLTTAGTTQARRALVEGAWA
jgi:transposase